MKTFSFQLDNCKPEDALFLGDVMRLFADPAHAHNANQLRAGRAQIRYTASGLALEGSNINPIIATKHRAVLSAMRERRPIAVTR